MICTPAVRGSLARSVGLRGRLASPPGSDLAVASSVSGVVIEVKVAEGARVKKGQVVAVIDDLAPKASSLGAQASLVRARAEASAAAAALDRAKAMSSAGITSKADLDAAVGRAESANADVAAQEAALGLAKGTLGRTEVRSSFEGVVTRLWRGPGALVDGSAQTPIVQLAGDDALEFSADGAERDLALVVNGAKASIDLTEAGRRLEGVVVSVPLVLDTTGVGTVRIAVARPDASAGNAPLRWGAFGRASIAAKPLDGVVFVPRSALRGAISDGPTVAICAHGKAAVTEVRVGYHDGDLVEIVSGLSEGMRVVSVGDVLGLENRYTAHRGHRADRGAVVERGGVVERGAFLERRPVKLLALLGRYRTTVWLLVALLVALGVSSALSLPSSIYPEVEFPRIVVVARQGDDPPDVFVTTITRPLETSLSSAQGLKRIESKTIRGATEISLDFVPGTDMWQSLLLVQASVGEARSELPEGTEITVEKITTGSFPVVTFNLSGPVDPRVLRESAELVVQPTFAAVAGVGRVEIVGGDERETEVILDPDALASLGLTPREVSETVRNGVALTAVGRVDDDRASSTVLVDAEPSSPAVLEEIPLGAGIVRLGSAAEIVDGHVDRVARVGGPNGETVAISVARLPDASTPEVVEAVERAATSLAKHLPAGATLEPVYDQALLVRESIASVRDAILIGILLCFAVIAAFLRDARAGLVQSASIPITLAITFVAMRVFHQTLNLMSLGGMAVAIGIVIDDAIVVIEAISHHRALGLSIDEAASRGTVELAGPVVGTTLTTVVVFVPLAFYEGMIGDFFRALAFTVVVAVLVSMFVALVLVPLAARVGLSRKAPRPPRPHPRIHRWFLGVARRPLLALAAIVVVLGVGALVVPRIPAGFLPQMDEGGFVVDYFLPAGSSLDATNRAASKVETILEGVPEIKTFARRTGAELGPATATEVSRGDVMVRLVDRGLRKRSAQQIIEELREKLGDDVPEARFEFVEVLKDVLDDLNGNPRPIEVKLFAENDEHLGEAAKQVGERIQPIAGVVDLFDGVELPSKEVRFRVRRDALSELAMTPADVEANLAATLRGDVVGHSRRGDRLVGVRVRYPDPVRFDLERLRDLPLVTPNGRRTTFRTVADLDERSSPTVLRHEALQPMLSVTADFEGRDLGAVGADVSTAVDALVLPAGTRAVVGGQVEAQNSARRSILAIAGVSLFLVLAVLAALFRRVRLAFLVLVAVPIALVGAALALLATGSEIDASSLMGIVLLIGLVVKNGVLLLEAAEQNFDEGAAATEAVARAAERRLRPILMTTTATIAGLVPLAVGVGAGSELQRPLAIAVIGGLVTSTLATLVLVPPLAAFLLARSSRKARAGSDEEEAFGSS